MEQVFVQPPERLVPHDGVQDDLICERRDRLEYGCCRTLVRRKDEPVFELEDQSAYPFPVIKLWQFKDNSNISSERSRLHPQHVFKHFVHDSVHFLLLLFCLIQVDDCLVYE